MFYWYSDFWALPNSRDRNVIYIWHGISENKNVTKEIAEQSDTNSSDLGFRVLRIDTSNMSDIYYTPDAVTRDDLFDQVENVKSNRTEEDLLFQVMIDWGVDLTLPIRRETIANKKSFCRYPIG